MTKNWQKILEVAFIAAGTSLSFFCLVYIFSRCEKFQPGYNFTAYHSTVCERSEFSPMSTLLFNSQSGQIHALLSNQLQLETLETIAFMAVWFFFSVITYGISVPAGLFLPAIIMGCALGQLYQNVSQSIFPQYTVADSYMIVGAAAMLAGYTRQTYSLAIIMLETTQSINLFLPMIFAIVVSVSVGNYFNKSIYRQTCDLKQIPVLSDSVPFENLFVRAEEIMTPQVQTVAQISSVGSLKTTLKKGFSSYPVVDNNGTLVGLISSRFI